MQNSTYNHAETAAGKALLAQIKADKEFVLSFMAIPVNSSPESHANWVGAVKSVHMMDAKALRLAADAAAKMDLVLKEIEKVSKEFKASMDLELASDIQSICRRSCDSIIVMNMVSDREREEIRAIANVKVDGKTSERIISRWDRLGFNEVQLMLINTAISI